MRLPSLVASSFFDRLSRPLIESRAMKGISFVYRKGFLDELSILGAMGLHQLGNDAGTQPSLASSIFIAKLCCDIFNTQLRLVLSIAAEEMNLKGLQKFLNPSALDKVVKTGESIGNQRTFTYKTVFGDPLNTFSLIYFGIKKFIRDFPTTTHKLGTFYDKFERICALPEKSSDTPQKIRIKLVERSQKI